MKLSNKVYDILKWVALIVLPALATFCSVLSGIWGLPFGEQIPATLTAIGLLVGTLIGISTAKYKKESE